MKILIFVLFVAFSIYVARKSFKWIFIIDEISREEAALLFLEKKVEFTWRPQIIDTPIITNVVDFKTLKERRKERTHAN